MAEARCMICGAPGYGDEPCPNCKNVYTCTACDGEGETSKNIFRDLLTGVVESRVKICDVCNGKGYIFDG